MSPLLSDGSLVKGQLVTLEDVAVAAAALTGARADDGVQATGLELSLQGGLHLAGSLESLLPLGLDALADLLLLDLGLLALSSAAQGGAVVCLVPLSEGRGVDLDDRGLGQGVGADEFVVAGVEGDDDDSDLAGHTFASPAEVAAVEAKGSVLGVASSGADEVNSLAADTGVGRLTSLFEGTAKQETRQNF